MKRKMFEIFKYEYPDGFRKERILAIYSRAKAYMRTYGNTGQWTGGYPAWEDILADIEAGHFHLVCKAGTDKTSPASGDIIGCFCFRPSPEPNYSVIEDGEWPDDRPYWVIHRLASDGSAKGVGEAVLGWCLEQCGNLRADTHKDNSPMLHLLSKSGFRRCGIIHVEDGTERIAFQKSLSENQ